MMGTNPIEVDKGAGEIKEEFEETREFSALLPELFARFFATLCLLSASFF
jgi:hypothetical protein